MLTTIKKTTSLVALSLVSTLSFVTPQAVHAQSAPPIINNEILAKNQIKNFERVNEGILRGAMPNDKDLSVLAKSGVKTIIDLRKPGKLVEHESVKARELGLEYVHIPLGFTNPNPETMSKILALVSDTKKQPVFVHCRQGADRTGMTIGMYRRLHDNWEMQKTYEEMRKHHFKPFLQGMKAAVEKCLLNQAFVSAVKPPAVPTLVVETQPAVAVD